MEPETNLSIVQNIQKIQNGEIEIFPIVTLDEDLCHFIDAHTTTVLFSRYTLEKQLIRHPDLDINEYELLQARMDNAAVIKEGRNGYTRHLLFITHVGDGKWMKIVIKSTINGDELYLASYHLIKRREIIAMVNGGEILRHSNEMDEMIGI